MSDSLVVILDDNEEFRMSTAFLLDSSERQTVHFGDPKGTIEFLTELPHDRPCCLLLDIRMPLMSGLEVHDRLQERGLEIPVIYMTGHGDVPLAVNAMRKGALTFLEKPLDPALLEAAINQALSARFQRRRLSIEEREHVVRARHGANELTPRERQVLEQVVDGKSNKEIARAFDISLKTVEMHRARVMRKMGARSAAQLVRLVYSQRDD